MSFVPGVFEPTSSRFVEVLPFCRKLLTEWLLSFRCACLRQKILTECLAGVFWTALKSQGRVQRVHWRWLWISSWPALGIEWGLTLFDPWQRFCALWKVVIQCPGHELMFWCIAHTQSAGKGQCQLGSWPRSCLDSSWFILIHLDSFRLWAKKLIGLSSF